MCFFVTRIFFVGQSTIGMGVWKVKRIYEKAHFVGTCKTQVIWNRIWMLNSKLIVKVYGLAI